MIGDRSPKRRRPENPVPPRPPRPEPPQLIHRGPPPASAETVPQRRVSAPVSRVNVPVPQRVSPHPSQPPPRPVAPRTRRKRGKRRWGRRVALGLLIAALMAGAGLIGGAIWFDKTLHRAAVLADYTDRPAAGRGTNWLLVGSDSREGLTADQQQDLSTGGDVGAGRTDTILLVHVPSFGSSTPPTMVSIPRDSYVPIPGHGKDKINSAFATGGAPLLTQTVEQATGLRLNHYVEIGFGGFAALVDALGGITVCPVAPITDPLSGIDLPAGCQKLEGRNALGYVRSRATPRADLDRMVNQRQFMSALLRRASSPAVWLNPVRWYSVPRAAADALTVDQGDQVWDLARLGWALHGTITSVTVPIGQFSSGDAGAVVVWNHDVAAKLFDALAADRPVPDEALQGQQ
ncbi:LytTR family transcriptional regulator [Mycobacterium sp. IS-2888]|uniref:LCP family protein n=1 Tax=Mycobacterium sp. IS-2888 TaxID=1834159 RepID=UPI00096E79CD|nr:LCP family protein [Mycobacterium sp. IS-2888]OMC51771.1 LytTR family transcriptional regulator [Mycobacterium sp. IS-2888]